MATMTIVSLALIISLGLEIMIRLAIMKELE